MESMILRTSFEDIERYHKTLYSTFRAGKCRPLSYRRGQLYALARMCQENCDAFADAVYQDLQKPKLEFFATEIGMIIQRALLCAERLEEWTRPEKCPNLPDWQESWDPTIYRVPKGPVLIISPWNYPLILSLQSLYSAISAGCPAVIKPSEFAPAYAKLLTELLPKYLDPRAYVVVNGAAEEATKLLSLRWAHIGYTGNGRIGRIVATAAAKHLTPVTLELGGKSPVFVDAETTDLKIAARRILHGKCHNTGQLCVAPDYVLVPRTAQGALADALKEVLAERYPEGALASDSYGRIVNAVHFERLKNLLSSSNGHVVAGGEMDAARLKIAPTIVKDVTSEDSLLGEEIFGPLLPIVPVADLNEAIDFVNSRDSPLAFYVFTENDEVKERLLAETLSGALVFNDTVDHLSVNEMPFSGVNGSGYGVQHMKYGFDCFTHSRSSENVPLSYEPHFAARYPPYTAEKLEIMSSNLHLTIPSV